MHKKGVFADTEKICFTAPKRGKFIRKKHRNRIIFHANSSKSIGKLDLISLFSSKNKRFFLISFEKKEEKNGKE
jgi:hypothetical protein